MLGGRRRPPGIGLVVGGVTLLVAAFVGTSSTCATPAEDLAIRDVELWDGIGDAFRSGMTVLVRGQRIAAVGPTESVAIPENARVVGGSSRYLVPGFWDMHVHALWDEAVPETFLPLFVAHGVTGVRDMGGTLDHLRRAREALRRGDLVGPRLMAAGMILDGPEPIHPDVSVAVETPAETERAVERLADAGADFVKVYTLLPAAAFEAAVAAAERHSLPVAGHVPAEVGAVDAARHGMRSIEHMMRALGGFCDPAESAQCEPIFDALREHGTWQVPTLVIERDSGASDAREDPRLRFLPRSVLDYWFEREPRDAPTPPSDSDELDQKDLQEAVRLAAALHRAGIPLLAGSDTGVPYSFPGWSLHEELELLVAAGLTPSEALTAATRGPAEMLDRSDELGTIESGKLADLVLLRENPLEDIRHTTTIEAVVLDGVLHDREELDRLLRQVTSVAASTR